MNQHALRRIALIGGIALIAGAFGLGYQRALPPELSAPANVDEAVSAVRAALVNPNQLEGAGDLAPVLASVDARDLDAVVGAYEETFTAVGPSELAMELLAEAWSGIDPAGAVERMEPWPAYWRDMTLPHLMRSWARRDLPSARAAVATIEPEALRKSASKAVILGWDDSGDPAIWDAYVEGLPFGSEAAPDLIRRIAAREGVEALLRRAVTVPEEAGARFRGVALRRAVDLAAQTDPELAAEFAEANRESTGGLERIVATRWAERDGPGATAWALARPAGRSRERILRAAFESWLVSDPEAALEWAGHQPEEVLTAIVAPYASVLGRRDPQRGLEMSVGIADDRERTRLQRLLARNWLAQDPETAASWLRENDLADLIVGNRPPRHRGQAPGPTGAPPGGGKDG